MPQIKQAKSSSALVVRDGTLIIPDEERFAPIWLKDGLIEAISDCCPGADPSRPHLEADGCYVTPGLIDLQVNGGPECDLWADPDDAALYQLRKFMAGCGVTSFLPTLITDEIPRLKAKIARLGKSGVSREPQADLVSDSQPVAARMLGLHLEGPFLSPERPGVHPPQSIQPLSSRAVRELVTDAVSLVTLAPEGDAGGQAIEFLKERGILVALGHSNATFEQAKAAFDRGVRLMTHTFNALPALHHRAPGAVGAALLDPRVYCCVIADGLHVNREIVELIVKLKGVERTILVTDRAAVGTTQGGLVGSSLTLDQAVRNVVEWGIASFADAVRMASLNPAVALGLDRRLGRLSPGALADLVIWDAESLKIKHVVVGGRLA